MKTEYIYIIRSKINNKIYIGKTNNIVLRKAEHKLKLETNKHYNKYLQNHYNKYNIKGFDSVFTFEILENNILKSNIEEKEKLYIKKFDSTNRNNGFNICLGGEGNWTEEQKIKRQRTCRLLYGKDIFVYKLDGTFLYQFNSISECAEKMNLKLSGVRNAFNREIRYKDFLFLKEKRIFEKYIPKQTRKTVYINIYDLNNNIIDVVKSLKECAEKYNINYNTLNTYCRRGTIVNNQYIFEKAN